MIEQPVSVIVAIYNEASTVSELLTALSNQTHPPDEIVIVDGGSQDGTVEALHVHGADLPLRVVVAPGTNISAARNRAVRESRYDLLAVTDAGCRPAPMWLEQLLALFENKADVVCGVFRMTPQTDFEDCVGRCSGTHWLHIQGQALRPSARSLAFRRAAWQTVGGFPERVYAGEDLWFVLTLAERGYQVQTASDAVVDWRPRSSYCAVVRQFYLYARDTARMGLTGRMYRRTLLQDGVWVGLFLWGLRSLHPWPWILLVGLAILYLYRKRREGCFAARGWRTFFRVPLILGSIHLGVVTGVARGLLMRMRKRL